ncbi:hypothetical protein M0805_001755 [Coniferiporia weirii]|nr:hypothetical protein M0805_001755 [Coniferiporia weirii]
MSYREARPSTDQEGAPLLRDPDDEHGENGTYRRPRKSFTDHVNDIAREPLTTLTKILLVLALLLLLLTSVFVGLFAGAEHKLGQDRGSKHPHVTDTATKTLIGTSTVFDTSTVVDTTVTVSTTTATTTEVKDTTDVRTTTEVQTTTRIQTTTEVQTTTLLPEPPLPGPTGQPGSNLCTSSECVILSASIIESLDETQDPCENFYEFANGGWLSKNEIPSGKGSYGSFDMVSQGNKRIIRKILDPPTDEVSVADLYDDETLKKLRDLYSSCMNEDILNDRAIKPLQDITSEIRNLYNANDWKKVKTEGQNVLDNSQLKSASKHGLTAAISYMHSRGIEGLFGFDIDGDVGVDPNFMTLWFFQPSLGLPSKEYFEEKDIRDLYRETLAHMLLSLDSDDKEYIAPQDVIDHDTEEKVKVWPPWPWPPWGDDDDNNDDDKGPPNKDKERANALAREVVRFERRIADASLDLEVLQDPIATYNPAKFADLAAQLPQIDFPMYFSTFTPRNFPERVILTSTTYASSLAYILDTTGADVIEAYLVTRAALSLAPYLSHDTGVWRVKRTLEETLQGIPKGQVPDRSDWCVQRVEDALGFAAGRFFVQETFGGDSKEKGTKVITDIIDAFKDSLTNLNWMDEESATAAAEKADAIRVKVGYPLSPDTKSARSIALYYRLVLVDKTEFFGSMVNAQISEEYKKWQTLGKQRDVESWIFPPSIVNAYFNPPANEIVFPAGILRPPFFSYKWPAYLQYGAFGMVAAHELTHAFDSSGRLYNQHGKLEQWWTDETSNGFNKIQKCISDQYSNYTIDDGKGGKVHVNGNLTSGENIGDSGLIQAYRAWYGQFHTSLQQGREYLLPGLDYTQGQLFFIGFGQIWSQIIKPAAALQRVRTDPHSPNKYRVEGTLSNIPEFAAAFQCKPGSKLNPPKGKRCVLW